MQPRLASGKWAEGCQVLHEEQNAASCRQATYWQACHRLFSPRVAASGTQSHPFLTYAVTLCIQGSDMASTSGHAW
jgi:hypothetical protein